MDIADGESLPMPVLLHVATARAVVSRGVSPPAGSPARVGGVWPRGAGRRIEPHALRPRCTALRM